MRAHLGRGFPLMADANMRWSVDEAIRAARALADSAAGVAGGADDPRRRPRPRARSCARAACRSPPARTSTRSTSSAQLIAAGGVTFPEPDVTNCGGVSVFMKVCHLAEAFNLPVTSHGAHDISVHLLAAAAEPLVPEAHGFGLDRFIAEPLRIEEGCAVAPERPGHGVAFDWKKLDTVRAS